MTTEGHRFQRVPVPPHFYFICFSCGKQTYTGYSECWADLNGPPFKGLYCSECKEAASQVEGRVVCPECGGQGWYTNSYDPRICSMCNGDGYVIRQR